MRALQSFELRRCRPFSGQLWRARAPGFDAQEKSNQRSTRDVSPQSGSMASVCKDTSKHRRIAEQKTGDASSVALVCN